MTLLYIICALLFVAVVVPVMMLSAERRRRAENSARLSAAESALEQARAELRHQEEVYNQRLEERSACVTDLTEKLARSEARVEALGEKIAGDRQELEKLQASFRLEFRNLAAEMMKEKSEEFKAVNRESMDAVLGPFQNSIKEFRERVEKIYSEENTNRGELRNELKSLHELNRRITEETTALTNALRGNSKVQGDWGEMILKTILDGSNLVENIHYTIQQNLKDEYGNNLRPDVILHLPGDKRIVIDSKVSLTAFVNYCDEKDTVRRDRLLKEHILSFRRHIDELGTKRYQNLIAESPDFVIMFVPNEPAFLCALQNESALWTDAYNKKVIVSSPTNLFALLKIVDDLWRRVDQSRNALRIAEEGGKLYDKFVGFVESMKAVGKGIENARVSYDKAYDQLTEGRGNLVSRAQKMRTLHVKALKNLPADLVEDALENDALERGVQQDQEEVSDAERPDMGDGDQ